MPINDLMPAQGDVDMEVEDNTGTVPASSPEPVTAAEPVADESDMDAPVETTEQQAEKVEKQKRDRSLEGRKATIQGEINDLVRQKGSTQRERDAIAAEVSRLREEREQIAQAIEAAKRGERPGQPETPRRRQQHPAWGRTSENDQAPAESEYDDVTEYFRDHAAWAAREAIRVDRFDQAQERERQGRAHYEEQTARGWSERYTSFAAANPTFEQEVEREDLLLPRVMVDVIRQSDVGPQMMLHYARHPDEIDRIKAMHGVLAYGEMKKLEARLEAAHSGPAPVERSVSKARPPIKPVESAGTGSNDDGEPSDDLDVDDFIARGNALEKRKRQGGRRA